MASTESHMPIRTSGAIALGNQLIHYFVLGSGKRLVFAFHGYANTAALFDFVANEDCTVLCFDLPYQGMSLWPEDQLIQPQDLAQMLVDLMNQYEVTQCSLLGFSIGARYCLTLMARIPDAIDRLVLVAPDGLRRNYLYGFLTRTQIGHFLFKRFAHNGAAYLRLFAMLQQLGFIPRDKYLFAMQYIRNEAARGLLYQIWMNTRLLVPDLKQLQQQIQPSTSIHLFMGRYDNIIPLVQGLRLKRKMPCVQLHIVDKGHNLMDDSSVQVAIRKSLLNQTNSLGC
jgi:pimeloyl-ACP methyl ester carboxylesterase